MDDENNKNDSPVNTSSNMKHTSSKEEHNDVKNSSFGPTFLLAWVWNWLTNIYAGFKSGEFLSKFSVLDAMFQFIFAVATSCHPQEEFELEEYKNKETQEKPKGELKVFGGSGKTLRSRTVKSES